jgi:hypothetical protein
MEKQIAGLLKQNQSIYGSLKVKDVPGLGELAILDSSLPLEEQKDLLSKENARLKELAKAFKPPEEPKAIKSKPISQPKPKESKPVDPDDFDQEENYELPVPKFTTIGNMEDLKRAFFSGEYSQFEEIVKASPYKFYQATYKFASDKNGAPDYSARNLIKGFTRSFDDYRKYFMICFRCIQSLDSSTELKYSYPSIWIVNAIEPIENIIGSNVENFDLVEASDPDYIKELLLQMRKMDKETPGLIGEGFVH